MTLIIKPQASHGSTRGPHQCCLKLLSLSLTLESPLGSKEIKPVHTEGNQSWIFNGRTDAEVEAPVLWPPDAKSWLIWKDPNTGKDWKQEVKGITEDKMVGRHYQLNGHESNQAPGDGNGQGGLACCSPWGCKESDTSEWLNWTDTWHSLQVQTFPEPLSISMALQDAMSTPITGEVVCVCVCVWLFPVWVVSFIEVAMTSEKAPISTDLSTHMYSPSIRWGRNIITPTLQKERHKYLLPLGEGKQRMAYFFPRKVNIIISSPSLFIGQAKSQIPRICGIGCEKWQSNLTEFNSI